MKFKEGQVITLPKGFYVRVDVAAQHIQMLSEDTRILIESVWTADRGPRQDHFVDCVLAAGRPLGSDNVYSTKGTRYIFALEGDYHARYILPDSVQAEADVFHRTYVK